MFPPDTLCEWLSEAGASVNELPVELPEGEFGSARPGDLTCRQMIAALFSLTPLFEKSSGFNRKCPRCFDTVAWIPSPPGLAYGHSMPLFMWDNRSAKTVFSPLSVSLSLSLLPSFFLYLSTFLFTSYFFLSRWKWLSCSINIGKNNKIIQQQHSCKGRGNKCGGGILPPTASRQELIHLKLSQRS